MSKNWYIISTYAGYEDKIEKLLNMKIESGEISSDIVTSVKVPKEEVVEFVKAKDRKTGKEIEKKKVVKNKILPGYIMLEMDLPEVGWKETCSVIHRIQGVSDFVGTNPSQKPRPISTAEVRNIFRRTGDLPGEKNVRIKQNYSVGDQVKLNDGPFANFSGPIDEIYPEKNKLKVLLQVFGRVTPVEVDASQVEKLVK
ncbi:MULTISPECIES: transcription termination/antitermination protein NusG [Treponema]|jgi:transcriptional antiterminator NusG|uniref:Transcription termination/antitermination protein NusG n=1 Tax=Treponema saccharophilum DSM 2985 TaxID=907348 RepID=H7ENF4_9SPIR|nr:MULTISPECIES: transcription termination/antitermination protein NusG [Treponema]EIC00882.1 transcription antitermination protein nusG [Treponema saccharophilum DSM 2985]MBQ5538288.1 transcription termination/antitermination factor NusG [Treponema sp.]BDC95198.1 transcription termination/antitermination protein NusG [Treponema saccharophilum]